MCWHGILDNLAPAAVRNPIDDFFMVSTADEAPPSAPFAAAGFPTLEDMLTEWHR